MKRTTETAGKPVIFAIDVSLYLLVYPYYFAHRLDFEPNDETMFPYGIE